MYNIFGSVTSTLFMSIIRLGWFGLDFFGNFVCSNRSFGSDQIRLIWVYIVCDMYMTFSGILRNWLLSGSRRISSKPRFVAGGANSFSIRADPRRWGTKIRKTCRGLAFSFYFKKYSPRTLESEIMAVFTDANSSRTGVCRKTREFLMWRTRSYVRLWHSRSVAWITMALPSFVELNFYYTNIWTDETDEASMFFELINIVSCE